jgi:hypothetical protein
MPLTIPGGAVQPTVSVITSLREVRVSPTCASTTILDLSLGNAFAFTLSTNISILTLANAPASGFLYVFILDLTMDGTARTITWPAAIKWAGGNTPALTSTVGKRDVFAFMTSDGGSTWIGSVFGQNC